jgi:cytochrome d ubiquinol oxidase subunit I
MDDLLLARMQMAVSLAFHIIFAVVGIGMPVLMVIAEWRWRSGRCLAAERLAKQWAKGTAIFFAVGAVSGTVLSFELGLLWPAFMAKAGSIIGLPFGLEGFAFFTEAIFLGIYLYAWDKVNRWMHLAAGVLVAVSGAASAAFVIMVNSWMNAPTGFHYDHQSGAFSSIDPIAAMFNPAWAAQTVHMLVAAYMATAFAVAGVHALQIIRHGKRDFDLEALKIAMAIAVPMSLAQPFVGDWAASVVAETQPVKLAAMEGQFKTESYAPLRIGGLPDETTRTTNYAIEIPGVLSYLAYGAAKAEVVGLNDVPKENWPPVAVTHIAFQIMVGCGMAMAAVASWFLGSLVYRRGLRPSRTLLWSIVLCMPLGFIAIETGWIVTEVGRQPWIISGVMRASEAVTPMPGLLAPFVAFTVVYAGLAVIVTMLMVRQIRQSRRDLDSHGSP